MAFAALAQYHGAQASAEEKKFGEKLSRLQEAQKLMEQAGNYINIGLNFQNEKIAIQKEMEMAIKDNNFIVPISRILRIL